MLVAAVSYSYNECHPYCETNQSHQMEMLAEIVKDLT